MGHYHLRISYPFIDLQIATDKLLEYLREALTEAVAIPSLQEFPALGQALMFDRVHILPNTVLDSSTSGFADEYWADSGAGFPSTETPHPHVQVPAQNLYLTQGVALDPRLLLAIGTDSASLVSLPTIELILTSLVEVAIQNGEPTLSVIPIDLTFQPIPQVADGLARMAEQALLSQIQVINVPLATSPPLKNLIYSNAGVTTVSGGSVLCVRLQTAFAPEEWTRREWTDFHSGQFLDLLATFSQQGPRGDWAIRIASSVIETQVYNQLFPVLRHPASEVWLDNAGLQISVVPDANRIQVRINATFNIALGFAGEVLDAHVSALLQLYMSGPMLLSVDLAVQVNVSVPLELQLLTDLGLGIIAPFVLAAAVTEPGTKIAGPVTARDLFAGLYLGQTVELPINVVPTNLANNCVQTPVEVNVANKTAATSIACTQRVHLQLPFLRPAFLDLNTVAGLSDSFVTIGHVTPLPELPFPELQVVVLDPRWLPPIIACSEAAGSAKILERYAQDHSLFTCLTLVQVQGSAAVVAAYLASDAHSVVSKVTIEDPATVAVYIRYNPAWMADPKPVRVLVHTTAGVRLVDIPAPPPLDVQGLLSQGAALAGACFVALDPFFDYFGRYNPKWGPRPSPEGVVEHVEHLWEMRITGLAEAEAVDVREGPEGRTVATLLADGAGVASGSKLLPAGAGTAGDLSFQRLRAGDQVSTNATAIPGTGSGHGQAHEFRIDQTPIYRTAQIAFRAPVKRGELGMVAGRAVLAVVEAGGQLEVFDLSLPWKPRVIGRFEVPGLKGALAHRGGVTAWGDGGMLLLPVLEERGLRLGTPVVLGDERVLGAVLALGRLYVLTDEGFGEIDGDGAACWQQAEFASHLAAALDLLVLADDEGLSVFSATDLGHRLSRYEMRVVNLGDSSGPRARRAVYVKTSDSSGTVIDLGDPTHPRRAAEYLQGAPLSGVLKSGRTLVRIDSTRSRGAVFTAGPTSQG